jgi:hypothetical protein
MYGSKLFPGENGNKHTCSEFLAAAKNQSGNDVWDAILGIVDHKINPEPDLLALGGGADATTDSIYN